MNGLVTLLLTIYFLGLWWVITSYSDVAIKDLKVGEYSKPLIFDDRGVKKVRIVYLKTRTEPHQENLREDYNKVADRALDEKRQTTLEKWFKDHLPRYYITIDKEFADCNSLGDWWKYAVNR
jgi:peptidyl-prolyl cis-trans isomerase SurA